MWAAPEAPPVGERFVDRSDAGGSGAELSLEREAGLAVVLASRSVMAVYRRILQPLGLTHSQYLVLVSLWQHGPLSVKELGRLLHLDSATLSPLIKRLETAGLLLRARSMRDERVVVVSLTASGRAMRARAASVPAEVADHLATAGIDVGRLIEVLHGVTTIVDAQEAR